MVKGKPRYCLSVASLPAVIVAGLLRVSGASIFWFVFVANDTTK